LAAIRDLISEKLRKEMAFARRLGTAATWDILVIVSRVEAVLGCNSLIRDAGGLLFLVCSVPSKPFSVCFQGLAAVLIIVRLRAAPLLPCGAAEMPSYQLVWCWQGPGKHAWRRFEWSTSRRARGSSGGLLSPLVVPKRGFLNRLLRAGLDRRRNRRGFLAQAHILGLQLAADAKRSFSPRGQCDVADCHKSGTPTLRPRGL
jgi:hypothetical protein